MRKIEDYLDIINLPHHESKTKRKMSLNDRAAQFAPFAALNGHGEEMNEVARLTSKSTVLSNELIEEINAKLQIMKLHLNSLNFRIVYFEKDLRKECGTYRTYNGKVIDIDEFYKVLILEDDLIVKIKSIVEIDGNIFNLFMD